MLRSDIPICFLLLLALIPFRAATALTPEQVLGAYWEDPLFGQAASQSTIRVEILHERMWPEQLVVQAGQIIRFLIENKTDSLHILAFAKDVNTLLSDEAFDLFVQDEIHHQQQANASSLGHQHGGGQSDTKNTVDIVKRLDQKPSVTVPQGDRKEILVRFSEGGEVRLFCAMEGHHLEGYISTITVESMNEEKQ